MASEIVGILDSRNDAIAYCQGLALQGGGWRLPTYIELVSLADFTVSSPAIDSSAFPNTPVAPYWAASAVSGQAGVGWAVEFVYGTPGGEAVANLNRVRCVR